MPSRWRVVYPSAFAQAWDCPGKCNLPGLHWYTAGVGRVVWRVGRGAGCAFVPPYICTRLSPPPARRGCVGVCRVRGVCVVWCAVCRGCVVCPCIHAHACHPPPPAVVAVWRGVRCAVWGCRGVSPYICTRLSPPPEKGIKKSGAALLPPRLCGGVLISGFCSCRRACAWLLAFRRYRRVCSQRRQISRRLCPVQPPL